MLELNGSLRSFLTVLCRYTMSRFTLNSVSDSLSFKNLPLIQRWKDCRSFSFFSSDLIRGCEFFFDQSIWPSFLDPHQMCSFKQQSESAALWTRPDLLMLQMAFCIGHDKHLPVKSPRWQPIDKCTSSLKGKTNVLRVLDTSIQSLKKHIFRKWGCDFWRQRGILLTESSHGPDTTGRRFGRLSLLSQQQSPSVREITLIGCSAKQISTWEEKRKWGKQAND